MENEFLILLLLQALFDLQTIFAYYIKSKEEKRHGLSPRMYTALLAVVHQWPFHLDKPFINRAERLVAISNQVGDELGEDMRGCCIVIDGSLHLLEQDESAQLNYFYDEKHPDYNGWKGKYCKKGLYFFSFDGLIIWHCVLCPGGWHDGLLFDRASNFLAHLPAGCWILGDSAFPRIEGKVYRCRKDNELLPSDPEKAQKQLAVEALSGKL